MLAQASIPWQARHKLCCHAQYVAGLRCRRRKHSFPRRVQSGLTGCTVLALPRLPLLVPTLQPCGFVRCLLEVLISGLQYETEETYDYKSHFYKLNDAVKIDKIERIQDVVHSTLSRTVQKVCVIGRE